VKKDDKTPCGGCNKMTVSVRKGRAHYVCKECGRDKSLSDFLFWEATYAKD
jgi:tRNA(Ile2) C34 agmatinyltransferase TiaS